MDEERLQYTVSCYDATPEWLRAHTHRVLAQWLLQSGLTQEEAAAQVRAELERLERER